MDRCPRLHILSVLFSKRPRHMLKHPRKRSQPSGTTRSQEHPSPAGPQVQPAPPPPVQRSRDTICSPATRLRVKGTGDWGFPARPDDSLPPQQPPQPPPPPPPPLLDDPELPLRPQDFMEAPQDFVPPPPAAAKRPPMPQPHKRHEASMFRSRK
ncbi:amyloid beta A4 precursor protein-binding family B member 1-interacting protein-like [Hylobates moloch]|uniref:amyloid beta A4 precursor protein-binding family B member 1-interacting protein-like n=1 Tax=Hylobates moloch TaxID=81572 RepID=UPI00136228EB|nr:amyloid beta A4 precursor protein-binding family B member 1-interacting protein-like [Hylobates moloch]